MENSLPAKRNQQAITLTHSARALRIGEKLTEVNMLIGFKMDGPEIMSWADDLDRLMSYEQLEKLPFILDCFKTNELNYDHNRGIRNIFDALPRVEKTETGFRVLKQIW